MIEAQVRTHLISQEALKPYMTTYAGQMAVFNQEAPADTDPNWAQGSQYGRIVFYIDMQDDPQRNISGTMGVDLYCETDAPEEIEPILRAAIDGYFFSNAEVTIAVNWRNTQYFTDPTKQVIGATLTFDLLDFPNQQTTDPDPIALINDWSVSDLPIILGIEDVRVIGRDNLPEAWKPTNECPAIYWRLGDIRKCDWIPDTYNCSWQTATIWGHIMAPDNATATKIARVIDNTLTIKKRLIFEDLAPLMIDRSIQVTPTNDALKQGQIKLDGTYGILNIPPERPKMGNITISGKETVTWQTNHQ